MSKNNKLPFSFSSSSALILNSFNHVNNKDSTSAVDNFLRTTNYAPEKTDYRAYSEIKPKRSKKIAFKELGAPLDQPIPAFNADNKTKVAQLKMSSRKVKGILKKNPKYLIPNDILTEQIKKYDEILQHEQEPPFNPLNIEMTEKERKLLIDSFYFPAENQLSPEKKETKQPEITKNVEDGFKFNLIDYSLKKNIYENKEKEEEKSKKNVGVIRPAKNVFTSLVNEILVENPFSKLKNKNQREGESPLISTRKVPYYQEPSDPDKDAFVIPQNEKLKFTAEEHSIDSSGLFDYDKKQKLKRAKLEIDWTFHDENGNETSPNEKKNNQDTEKSPINAKKDEPSIKKPEEKETLARLKEIEASNTPILKEWPDKVNYNFSLPVNVSENEASLKKARDDLNNLMMLSGGKFARTEKENEEVNQETQKQISKLKFFLANYFIVNDSTRKTELVFTMVNKTVIKHDLHKKLWSYYQLDSIHFRFELFSFCSFNNQLIITGGIDPLLGEITKKTFIFDYDKKTLTEKSPLSVSRYRHLTMVAGNVVYCLGGCTKGDIGLKSCEKYFIEEDRWENMAALKVKRRFLRGTISKCNNFIYVLGGNDEDNNVILLVEKYDISADFWGMIHISDDFVITNQCKLLLLNKRNYNNKTFDDIIILDKKGGEFKSSLIDIETGVIDQELEFKLNPENYIILHQDSFFIFPLDSFEKSDKLSLKTSTVENINFDFCV